MITAWEALAKFLWLSYLTWSDSCLVLFINSFLVVLWRLVLSWDRRCPLVRRFLKSRYKRFESFEFSKCYDRNKGEKTMIDLGSIPGDQWALDGTMIGRSGNPWAPDGTMIGRSGDPWAPDGAMMKQRAQWTGPAVHRVGNEHFITTGAHCA